MLTNQATILVADIKNTLVMEIKDDSKTTFDEAIGLSTLIAKEVSYHMFLYSRIYGNKSNCTKISRNHTNN
jgi:hypothetical protein